MTTPIGFWDENSPISSSLSDLFTFEKHNMNRTLLQRGNQTFVQGVLTREGMLGYDRDIQVFYTVDSGGNVVALPHIKVGLEVDKPDESTGNNGSTYLASDTKQLHLIENGSRTSISLEFALNTVSVELTSLAGGDRLLIDDVSANPRVSKWAST